MLFEAIDTVRAGTNIISALPSISRAMID